MTPLEAALDAVLERLRSAVGGSRSTLRVDDPARGWSVATVCAEALAPGVASMRGDGSIDQRAAATAQWIERHRINLVQPDLTHDPDPAPPPALLSAYGAKAQMLGPLEDSAGHLAGWISVHYLKGPTPLGAVEAEALDVARAEVAALIGL